MASDSRKKPGRGFASTSRGAAVSRLLKKIEGISTVGTAERGLHGVRVHQAPYASYVTVRVFLDDDAEAAKWSADLEAKLIDAGYVLDSRVGPCAFAVTRDIWKFDDEIAAKIYTGGPAMESDVGMLAAHDYTVMHLRAIGWVQEGTRLLTEKGQAVRARLVVQAKAKVHAEARRLRQRGW